MATPIDYGQKLLDAVSDFSPYEMQKIYEAVVFLKEKFILPDEARYDTLSWIEAEREASEAYERREVKRLHTLREMADYTEAGADEIASRVPINQPSQQRVAGLHAGAIWTSDDFDESLP